MRGRRKASDPHRVSKRHRDATLRYLRYFFPTAKISVILGIGRRKEAQGRQYIEVPNTHLMSGLPDIVILVASYFNAKRTLDGWLDEAKDIPHLRNKIPVVILWDDDRYLPYLKVQMPLWAFVALLLNSSKGLRASRFRSRPTHIFISSPPDWNAEQGEDVPNLWSDLEARVSSNKKGNEHETQS